MKDYNYSDKVKLIKGQEHYTVYEVEIVKGNRDEAERRCRTVVSQRHDKLAGGCFTSKCLPYNFKTNYKVVKVPLSTKIQPYTKKDLAIIGLIEAESNMDYRIL